MYLGWDFTILLFENYLLDLTKLEADNDTDSWSHFLTNKIVPEQDTDIRPQL